MADMAEESAYLLWTEDWLDDCDSEEELFEPVQVEQTKKEKIMAQKAGRSEKVLTPEFRVSWPAVFEPKENENGDKKYGITMLFSKDTDIKALKRAAAEAVAQRWGANPPKNLRSPFKDGDGETETGINRKEKYPEQSGCILISANSKQRPNVVDQDVAPILDQSEFYGGCYARATVNAFTYGGEGTSLRPGVAFGLMNVQKTRDGKPFGIRSRAEDDFEAVAKEDASWSEDEGDVEALFG